MLIDTPRLSDLLRSYASSQAYVGGSFEDLFDGFLHHLTSTRYKVSDWTDAEWAEALIDVREDDVESLLCMVASWCD